MDAHQSSEGALGRGVDGWDAAHSQAPYGSGSPHPAVVEAVAGMPPGTALDIGCGTGRHSLWLAERGWRVTGLDSSSQGLQRAATAARDRGLDVRWVLADARDWQPGHLQYDLVVLCFVTLPQVLVSAPTWLRPGGLLVVVGHAERNLNEGVGGPRERSLHHDHVDVAARVTGKRLQVVTAAEVARQTPAGVAYDSVVIARRPT